MTDALVADDAVSLWLPPAEADQLAADLIAAETPQERQAVLAAVRDLGDGHWGTAP